MTVQTVLCLRSTSGWESVSLGFIGEYGQAPSDVFRARLEVETRFWDRSDGDLGQLGVNSRLRFEPVLVERSELWRLRACLQEWSGSRTSFSIDVGAENFSLVLSTLPPIGIQQNHQQAFSLLYRSEDERTTAEQRLVSDTTVIDQVILDLESFLGHNQRQAESEELSDENSPERD